MLSIKKIIPPLLLCLMCNAAFSQTTDSAAAVKLIINKWAPDSVIISGSRQDAALSKGASLTFHDDLTVRSVNPDGTEEASTWVYNAAAGSITIKQSDEDNSTLTFKVISVAEKSLVLTMSADGKSDDIRIYLSPAKE